MISLIASVDTLVIKVSDQFCLHIYKVANEPSSTHTPETDEVSHQLLNSVSDGDEKPDQRLFTADDFSKPKIINVNELPCGLFLLSIEHRRRDNNLQSVVFFDTNRNLVIH